MSIINELNQIIAKYHLLKHPFYQAWSEGKLDIAILQKYASQYYQQVSSFPRFVSRVHTHCPDIDARKVLLQNLVDEELHGTDHPALWMQFAEGLNLNHDTVKADQPFEQTKAMVDCYYDLADQDWRDGLCALYAYESQVPDVSVSKIDGLKKFYGITDESALAFFVAHQQYDVEHANQVAELIEKHVDKEQAKLATEKAAKALWQFLDGMCIAGNISCEMQ